MSEGPGRGGVPGRLLSELAEGRPLVLVDGEPGGAGPARYACAGPGCRFGLLVRRGAGGAGGEGAAGGDAPGASEVALGEHSPECSAACLAGAAGRAERARALRERLGPLKEPPAPPEAERRRELAARLAGHPSSLPAPGNAMEYGKPVVFVVSYDNLFVVTLAPGEVTRTNLGEFAHDEIVGRPYGSRLYSRGDRGYVYALRLDPALWTRALARQTQILFMPDISLILSKANVRPGSVVCEAGTGSGSLSTHLLAAVYPAGRLLTFDVEEPRTRAVVESTRLTLCEAPEAARAGVLSAETRDVCAEGYPARPWPAEGGEGGESGADPPGSRRALERGLRALARQAGVPEPEGAEGPGGGPGEGPGAGPGSGPERGAPPLPPPYADLVFLDIPEPDRAVDKAARVLKPGATLCVFCPCMEQIHRAIAACAALGCYGGFETAKMHSVAYELDTYRFAPLALHRRAPAKGPRAAGGGAGGEQGFPDRPDPPGLTPLPSTRLHTGYLMFARRSGGPAPTADP